MQSGLLAKAIVCVYITFKTPCLLAANECDAILEKGIYNTYQNLQKRDLRTGFRDALCTSNTSSGSGSKGGGLSVTLPIYDVPVTFGGNYNEAKSKAARSGSCSNSSSNLDDATYSFVLQQVVAPEIVAAWSECHSKTGGFMVNGELNGNVLTLEFRFRPVGNITNTRLTSDPDITGADCPSAQVRKGTIITNARVFEKCYRTGSGEITVIANSEFDGARLFIPAVKATQPLVQSKPQVDCQTWNGPGVPVECMGKQSGPPRVLPNVGVAPEGYTWCVLDAKFSFNNVQGYCFARETSGVCHCAQVPPGYPQPKMEWYGKVYQGP